MNETPFITAVITAFTEGMTSFLALVDWPYMGALIVLVFLSNLILPAKEDMSARFKWVAMHRYRVPLIAFALAFVFLVLRDYDNHGRSQVFTYFLTMTFAMCVNIWFLDKPADLVAVKYPWLKTLLKGRDPECGQ